MKLKDVASVIRSKNASPFVLTIDIVINDKEVYEKIKSKRILSEETIAKLFKISLENVLGVYYIDQINGIKISLLRPKPADDIHTSDIYGAQQYIPLLYLELTLE